MKNVVFSAILALSVVVGIEAAPTTSASPELQAIIERLNKLESENKAQAARIVELETRLKNNSYLISAVSQRVNRVGMRVTTTEHNYELQSAKLSKMSSAFTNLGDGTTTNESGRIYTLANGRKFYLADATAGIFEPLTESGLRFTPYGYLVFEGVYSTRPLDCDWSADFVKPKHGKSNNTTLSMQDSILGLQFMTPEPTHGWMFSGKAEFDLAGGNQNDYAFHWRHLYVNAEHESGWAVLFGQTWHLWKMVSPSEIDGAWMENAGHPYRRSPQVRVTKKWDWENSSLEARVGIVKGGPGMGGDRDSDGIEDNTASAWALFEGAVVYDRDAPWQDTSDSLQDGRWLVGLGGQYGNDRSARLTGMKADGTGIYEGQEDEYKSMMGMFAASVPFWRFTLKGQFYGGQDLGGVQAGCGQRVAYNTFGGRGNEVRTIGGFVDLGYKLTDRWSFALGWGCDNPVDSDVEASLANSSYILYNDRVYADVFYSITANFRLGLEYARLLTSYAEASGYGGDYDADRVQFSAFYDF